MVARSDAERETTTLGCGRSESRTGDVRCGVPAPLCKCSSRARLSFAASMVESAEVRFSVNDSRMLGREGDGWSARGRGGAGRDGVKRGRSGERSR
jgi:hypothetical protein